MTAEFRFARAVASSKARSRDASAVFQRDDRLVVVLADGGGGLRGGEAASGRLVEVVESAMSDRSFAIDRLEAWTDLFRAIDADLAARRYGKTTGVVVVLGPRGLLGLSTGNSEAWIVTATEVDKVTAAQRTSERLGATDAIPTSFERPVPRGAVLVASDGLFKYAAVDIIANIVRARPVDAAAAALVDLVRLSSGDVAEDVDVVVVHQAGPAGLAR